MGWTGIKALLNGRKLLLYSRLKVSKCNGNFLTVMAADEYTLAVLNIAGADFHTERYALHFILGTLPAHDTAFMDRCPNR